MGLLFWTIGRFERSNAARMSAAGDGSTAPNLYFLSVLSGKKMQTNLASSSKTLDSLRVSRFFPFSQCIFMTSSLTGEFAVRDEVIFMQKIIMPTEETKNFLEVFEMFVISQSASINQKSGRILFHYHCETRCGKAILISFNFNYV